MFVAQMLVYKSTEKILYSWFGLDKYQVLTKTSLSLPLLNWTGERKYDERLEG